MPLPLRLVPGRSALWPSARFQKQHGVPKSRTGRMWSGLAIYGVRSTPLHINAAPQLLVDRTSGGHKGLRPAQGVVCVMDDPKRTPLACAVLLCGFVTAVVVGHSALWRTSALVPQRVVT